MNLSSCAPRRAILWTLSAVFLALAVAAHGGRYSPLALCWLALALGSVSLGSASRGIIAPALRPDARRALDAVLLGGIALFGAAWIAPPADRSFQPLLFAASAAVFGLLLALLGRVLRASPLRRLVFPAFLVLQTLLGLFTIAQGHHDEQDSRRFPFHVRNDVQIFATESARLLSAGRNPYATRMTNVMGADLPFYFAGATGKDGRLPFGYPYLPLSLGWSLPGYWAGDFRFMHVLALIGTAYFLAYARPSRTSVLAATLFLLFPSTLFVLLMSWTEPVALFFLGATLWCYFRAPKWLPLALGCLIGAKQYTVFLLPLLPLLVPAKERWRPLLWKSVAVALALTLPLALWNVDGFVRSAVAMQFKQPFRADSLSFLVTVLRAGGPQLSPALGFAALAASTLASLRWAPRTPSGWCGAGALAYLGFFALNKQAFANYYFWVFGLLVAGVAVALPSASQHEEAG